MNELCTFPDCGRPLRAKGLCVGHLNQQYKKQDLRPLSVYKRRPTAPDGYAFCNRCENFKRTAEFYLTSTGAIRSHCKKCVLVRIKELKKEKEEAR